RALGRYELGAFRLGWFVTGHLRGKVKQVLSNQSAKPFLRPHPFLCVSFLAPWATRQDESAAAPLSSELSAIRFFPGQMRRPGQRSQALRVLRFANRPSGVA